MPDTLIEIDRLLAGINHPAPSATKYRRLESRLSELLGLGAGKIYTGYVSKAGNMTVRMTQSSRAQQADLLIALIPYPEEYEASVDAARSVVRRTGQMLLLMEQRQGVSPAWIPRHLLTGQPDPGIERLTNVLRSTLGGLPVEEVPGARRDASGTLPFDEVTAQTAPAPRLVPVLKIDERTRRMLKNAIASHKAIMLVGPPGTGKSSLIWEVIREVQADPSAYGMEGPHELMTVTADESWTVRELIGGDTIDSKGSIHFAPGYVLQAIQEDKWLLIDEANRADMDRIFGGLLTWLTGDSMESVTVGRAAPGDPTEIRLGWADTPVSAPMTEDEGMPGGVAQLRTIEYKAGQEWRLIGTYNSLDAQRVFRFGLALGRRFAQIPVAPPEPSLFREIFIERSSGLPLFEDQLSALADRVSRIYEIHYASPDTAMGPALFLSLTQSVTAGLKDSDVALEALLAEAYLICFGPWLARLDDPTLNELGEKLSEEDVLGSEWNWVNRQLQHIR
ncbi:MoxR-like ATPase [Streptomyces sp. PvR006]|uniref:AAA family ATPase n=1 Tax=Streptomyces sp. PvR006 TaxID=2817860 RepID=UPI001AE32EE3|nr:AAA family ATPase [Streptomyces sp. PvR006]MBP2584734.1 MoxR-like ATPase [Streptomyces sp. PvR006]